MGMVTHTRVNRGYEEYGGRGVEGGREGEGRAGANGPGGAGAIVMLAVRAKRNL